VTAFTQTAPGRLRMTSMTIYHPARERARRRLRLRIALALVAVGAALTALVYVA
jgi:hypothetical protein